MITLTAQSAPEYLRAAGRASAGEILVQELSEAAGVTTLKIFDTGAGDKVGTDLRSAGQKKLGKPDTRMNEGLCFVLTQAGPGQVSREKECLEVLANLLPAGSVPQMLWFDEKENILATSCAPAGAVVWKKELEAGRISMDAATHAGMLLAMMHAATHAEGTRLAGGTAVAGGVQARLSQCAGRHPGVAAAINSLLSRLDAMRLCLTHGDFVPANILLVPGEAPPEEPLKPARRSAGPSLSQVMIRNFAFSATGHPAIDDAALVAELLLLGFVNGKKWRPLMMLADNFWQTYRHTADPELVRPADACAGHLTGALLLSMSDEPSAGPPVPQEWIEQVRRAALDLLSQKDGSLEQALDTASLHFDDPD